MKEECSPLNSNKNVQVFWLFRVLVKSLQHYADSNLLLSSFLLVTLCVHIQFIWVYGEKMHKSVCTFIAIKFVAACCLVHLIHGHFYMSSRELYEKNNDIFWGSSQITMHLQFTIFHGLLVLTFLFIHWFSLFCLATLHIIVC
jgi:hypothetical protein